MTGRRLYDHYTDSLRNTESGWTRESDLPGAGNAYPIAWPYLSTRDQAVWNDLARRVSPQKPRR